MRSSFTELTRVASGTGGEIEAVVLGDLSDAPASAPAQQRHDEPDEHDLPGDRRPAEPVGSPPGEGEPRGRLLEDSGHRRARAEVGREGARHRGRGGTAVTKKDHTRRLSGHGECARRGRRSD